MSGGATPGAAAPMADSAGQSMPVANTQPIFSGGTGQSAPAANTFASNFTSGRSSAPAVNISPIFSGSTGPSLQGFANASYIIPPGQPTQMAQQQPSMQADPASMRSSFQPMMNYRQYMYGGPQARQQLMQQMNAPMSNYRQGPYIQPRSGGK